MQRMLRLIKAWGHTEVWEVPISHQEHQRCTREINVTDKIEIRWILTLEGVTPHSFDVDPVLMERLRDRYIENHLTWEHVKRN